jgi:outer membrane protein assembly factor BamA
MVLISKEKIVLDIGGGEKIFIKFQLNLNGQQLSRPTDLTYALRYSNTLIEDKKMVWGVSRFKQFRQENISQAGVLGTLRRNNVIRDGWSVDLFTPLNTALSHVAEVRSMDVEEVGGGIAYRKFALINQLKLDGVKNDPYQNPVAGWNISLQTENNLGGISDPNILAFDRYDLNANSYLSFTDNDVLALSFKAGFISIPPSLFLAEGEIYRMGGSGTVRGYHPDHPFAEGPRRLLLNAEIRHIFNPVITGVLFYDLGSAFPEGIDLSLFRTSPGIGVRFNTPIGPIKVDWGFAPQDNWQNYIHFSIGATF